MTVTLSMNAKRSQRTSELCGRLLQNGRYTERYDKLGHSLGSGGMGRVWSVCVRSGTWMALKVIPIKLDGVCAEVNLHTCLRECLSTFSDLSPAHVVRYESYWLEEPDHLPPDLWPTLHCGRAAWRAPDVDTDSGFDSLHEGSVRFAMQPSSPMKRAGSWGDCSPVLPFLPSAEDCGFIWECNEEVVEPVSVSRLLPAPRLPAPRLPDTQDCCVALLIEMELMGPAPGLSTAEERFTLRVWLQRESRTFSESADVFGALMASVRHIHRKRLVHADLKPDNVFCVMKKSRVAAVKIGDFGLAGESQFHREHGMRNAPGGTPGYVAPEMLRSGRKMGETPWSDKVDIFACAVILFEVLLPPFKTQMERVKALEMLSNGRLPLFISTRLPKTGALLQEMGDKDPKMRPSAEEVCKREKEVRKELCRSSVQRCSDANQDPTVVQSGSGCQEGGRRRKEGRRKGKASKPLAVDQQ